MKPTDLAGLYPAPVPPERTSWKDKLVLNALGLLAIFLLAVICFGLYGFYDWLYRMITILKGFL